MKDEIKELRKQIISLEQEIETKNKIIRNYEKQLKIYGTMDKYSELLKYIKESSVKGLNQ